MIAEAEQTYNEWVAKTEGVESMVTEAQLQATEILRNARRSANASIMELTEMARGRLKRAQDDAEKLISSAALEADAIRDRSQAEEMDARRRVRALEQRAAELVERISEVEHADERNTDRPIAG
jgi:F0F1-type ATP synthase membrane subunit b/b'